MPSLVVINLTNLVLNLAVCQVGPLYYENKVLKGGIMHRSLAHVYYTLEVKPWAKNTEYSDGIVFTKLAQAIFSLGGLLTPWEFANYFKTVDNSHVPFWYLKHHDLPWYKKPGIHMTRDRTFIIEGGPPEDMVNLSLAKDNSIEYFSLNDEKLPIGRLIIREIPFEESHKYHYIDSRINVRLESKNNRKSTVITTPSPPPEIET